MSGHHPWASLKHKNARGVYTLCLTVPAEPHIGHELLDKVREYVEDYGFDVLSAAGLPDVESPKEDDVYDVTPTGELQETPYDELCPRCQRIMSWDEGWKCRGCTWSDDEA